MLFASFHVPLSKWMEYSHLRQSEKQTLVSQEDDVVVQLSLMLESGKNEEIKKKV